MPQTPHTERHFTAGEVVRDVVIGMSDGLTVPFALAALFVTWRRRDLRLLGSPELLIAYSIVCAWPISALSSSSFQPI